MNTKYAIILILGLFCFAPELCARLLVVGTYCNPTKSFPLYSRKDWKIPQFEAANKIGTIFREGNKTCFYFKLPNDPHEVIKGSDGAGNKYEIRLDQEGTYKFKMEQMLAASSSGANRINYYTPVGEPKYIGTPKITYPNYPNIRRRIVEYQLDVKEPQ